MSFEICYNGNEQNLIILKPFFCFLFAQEDRFFFLAQGRTKGEKLMKHRTLAERRAECCARKEFHDPSRDSLVSYDRNNQEVA